eukprot:Seg5714.3 transcript_id=Seg5714.3/GoldUCD/mRNA.D3Y31 product="hypothetical protein" protein_id=Seg5714.3/GoldUCD/D3Y31
MFTKCLEKALQGANRINQASAARSNVAVKLQSYNSRIIQPQCCFSTNSKYSKSKKESTGSPIQLSSSPVKDYKTARTFGDTKLQGKFSMTPIYIGFVLTGILTYVVFFVEGEPLDIFSTEVLEKLEKQVAQNVNVEKPLDTNSDKHVDDKSV